jgi:hypothetical protein
MGPGPPAAPVDPSSPLHPMKSNGTIRKIEHINISILFDIVPSCFRG